MTDVNEKLRSDAIVRVRSKLIQITFMLVRITDIDLTLMNR